MKGLTVDQQKCTGCRRCELACSFYHSREYSLGRARLHVVREAELDGPVVCVQCGLCQDVCPVEGAIIRDTRTSAFLITTKCDFEECDVECANACPYGVIHIDSKLNRAVKCDFCAGSPSCVTSCPWNVIHYIDVMSPHALNSKRITVLRSRAKRETSLAKTELPLWTGGV